MNKDKTPHNNLFKFSNTSMTSRISEFTSKQEKKGEIKIPINLKKRDITNLVNIMGMIDNDSSNKNKLRDNSLRKEKIKNMKSTNLQEFSFNTNNIKRGGAKNINKTYNLNLAHSAKKSESSNHQGLVDHKKHINHVNFASSICYKPPSSKDSSEKSSKVKALEKLYEKCERHKPECIEGVFSGSSISKVKNSHHNQSKSLDINLDMLNQLSHINQSNNRNPQNPQNAIQALGQSINNLRLNNSVNKTNEKSGSNKSQVKKNNISDKTTGDNTITISNRNKSDFHTIKYKEKQEKMEFTDITGPEDLHFSNVVNMQNNKIISKQWEKNKSFEDDCMYMDDWVS